MLHFFTLKGILSKLLLLLSMITLYSWEEQLYHNPHTTERVISGIRLFEEVTVTRSIGPVLSCYDLADRWACRADNWKVINLAETHPEFYLLWFPKWQYWILAPIFKDLKSEFYEQYLPFCCLNRLSEFLYFLVKNWVWYCVMFVIRSIAM